MDSKVKRKIVPLLSRISTSVNQGKSTKTLEEPQSLLERISDQEPSLLSRMEPHQTLSNMQQDDSVLNLSSTTIATGEKPKPLLLRLSSKNSRENRNSPMKRKNQFSDFISRRSIRQKRESDVDCLRMSERPHVEGNLQEDKINQNQPHPKGQLTTNNPNQGLIPRVMMTSRRNGSVSRKRICHGSSKEVSNQVQTPVVSKQSNPYNSSIETLKDANFSLASQMVHQTTSHLHNGKESLKANLSISIRSSLLSTGLQLLKNGRHELERQISYLDQLKRRGKLRLPLTGQPHGDALREPSHLPSLIEPGSLTTTPSTLKANSPPNSRLVITESSSLTSPLETLYMVGNKSYLPTPIDSDHSIPRLSYPMEYNMPVADERPYRHEEGQRSVIDLMPRVVPAPAAGTATCAKNVEALTTVKQPVRQPQRIEFYGLRPKYLRYNIWDPEGNLAMTSAEWTHTAKPLPRPPSEQLMHPVVGKTVSDHSNLFKIISPIKIDHFKNLLHDHPNQPFVKSVCEGLKYGFWPWADMET